MITNSSEGSWKIGNTSCNWSVDDIKEKVSLFLEGLQEFNEIHQIEYNDNKERQLAIFNFFSQSERYNFLTNKYNGDCDIKRKNIRARISFLKHYNLLNEDGFLTEFGKMYIAYDNTYVKELLKIIKNTNFSLENIIIIVSLLSKNDENSEKFYILIEELIKNEKLPLKNINASRYATNIDEFKKILKFDDEKDLIKFLFSHLKENGYNKIKNRKSENYDCGPRIINIIQNVLNNSQNLNQKKYEIVQEIKNLEIKKGSEKYIEILNLIKENDFFWELKDSEKIYWFSYYISLYLRDNYYQQFKILGKLTSLFDINKENGKNYIRKLRNSNFLNLNGITFQSLNNFEKIIKIFNTNYSNLCSKNSQKYHDILELFKTKNIFDDFLNWSTKKDDYIEELRSKKRFVLLEYFTSIFFSKLFGLKFNDISNMILDNNYLPVSHAPGLGPDIFIEKENLMIEVSNSIDRHTVKLEIEPIPRHLHEKILKYGDQCFAIFITNAPINTNIYYNFISWRNKNYYYDKNKYIRKLKIITLSIEDISKMYNLNREKFLETIKKIDELDELSSKQILINKWDIEEYEESRKQIFSNI